MEAFAYQLLTANALVSFLISWVISVISAGIGVSLITHRFRLRRAPYFFLYAFEIFLLSFTSLVFIDMPSAMQSGGLALRAAMYLGALVPIGFVGGVLSAARALDGYGNRERWILAYIPIANILFLLKKSQEAGKPGVLSKVVAAVLVVLGFLFMAAGHNISKSVETYATKAASDPQVQANAVRYGIQAKGIEGLLTDIARNTNAPVVIDSGTILMKVEADRRTLRNIYSVSGENTQFDNNLHYITMTRWCRSPKLKELTDAGATVEGVYRSTSGQGSGTVTISTGLCSDWMRELAEMYKAAAKSIEVPEKIDDITTLTGVDYSEHIMTYRYEIAETATFTSSNWREINTAEMCEAAGFKVLMSLDMKIRRAYYSADKSVIGEVVVDSNSCSARDGGGTARRG